MPTDMLSTLTATPLFAVGLTLAAYLLGNLIFKRLRNPSWLPAILIAALLLAAALVAIGLPYSIYQQGASWLTILLGPAT
ncbi:MAG: LrgB family protein, partial [Vreelandella alkaliphila]